MHMLSKTLLSDLKIWYMKANTLSECIFYLDIFVIIKLYAKIIKYDTFK